MKNLTRICLMAFTILLTHSFESEAFNNSIKLSRKKIENQIKKNIRLDWRCCTEYFIDENNCGTTMYVAATSCTEGTNISMEKICETAYTAAMKNFTYACEQEEPNN